MRNQIPNKFYKTIFDIDYQSLKDKGITTLFFDLDNTLIPYDVPVLTDEVIELLQKLQKDFKVLIITNNKPLRTKIAVAPLFDYFAKARKPFKCGYKKALKYVNSTVLETCAVGDQVKTDVLGARKMGMYSVLVNPIDQDSEGLPTKLNRYRERKVLNKIKRQNPQQYKETFGDFNVR